MTEAPTCGHSIERVPCANEATATFRREGRTPYFACPDHTDTLERLLSYREDETWERTDLT